MAQPPVKEFRMGSIKATVWRNESEADGRTVVRHNVTLARLYKEGDTWKQSESFGRDDLPLVAKLADMAHTWIYEQQTQAS